MGQVGLKITRGLLEFLSSSYPNEYSFSPRAGPELSIGGILEAKTLSTVKDLMQSDDELVDDKYRVAFSIECREPKDFGKARIPPFEEVEIDLGYVFGHSA